MASGYSFLSPKFSTQTSPVLTHTLSPPHLILKAVLVGVGEEEAVQVCCPITITMSAQFPSGKGY